MNQTPHAMRGPSALVAAIAVLATGGCATPGADAPTAGTTATPAARSAPAPAPRLLPDVQQVTLPNGALLQLAVKDDVPLVALSARLRGGAVADPPGKGGLAALTAGLLEKGAGERNARALADAVADVGGQLSAGSGLESASVSAEFLAEDTDLMIELVLDMLLSPTFDAVEFERARTRAIASMQAARDGDPRSLISRYGRAFLFGEHPYGKPSGGTETSLAALTVDDVIAHHRAHYGPDRLIVSVVGDIDPVAVRAALQDRLAGWRQAAEPAPPVAPPSLPAGRRVLLVDKPDATQTYFWIGSGGVAKTYPQDAALDVANTLFGGRFTSMLNTALRVESGLTYGASSRL
ncbi:MAG: pitrilysin family protein, partial [Pseudomonadota bacterium]